MKERPMFDLSNPGVRAIPSPMGGGWAVPITEEGEAALADFFGEDAAPIAPLGGKPGYMVEPFQSCDLACHLRAVGCAWEV
jgi:hypothetical protein